MIHYRVIYNDRPTWDSLLDNGRPYSFGIQAILQDQHEVGVEVVWGTDYNIFRDGRWWTVDYPAFIDYLAHTDHAHVLFGRMIDRERFSEIIAMTEGQKAGWLPGENWEN